MMFLRIECDIAEKLRQFCDFAAKISGNFFPSGKSKGLSVRDVINSQGAINRCVS